MIPENLTYEQIIKDMKACEQTKGMSVFDHGEMVRDYYHDLIDHLEKNIPLKYEWRLPNWIIDFKSLILDKIYDSNIVNDYTKFHDIGKPYCKTVDEEGKQHFPNHAEVSYQVYKEIFPTRFVVHELIKSDMDIHCLKSEGVEEFAKRPEGITLLIAGLCEIHANASMFGGIESTSLKIKWKQINKRGRQIIELLK